MRSEYKRDMNHNYLILEGDGEIDTASYQVRMLAGNVLPSILKCRLQGMDGKMLLYYDVTSRQPVSTFFEKKKLAAEDLRLIFGGFVRVIEEMAEYLLNPEFLILDPDYMFLDAEKKQLYFCCLPGCQRAVRDQLQALAEYVLPRLDHEDSGAVMLGYGIYRRALEEQFQLEYIKEELYRAPREEKAPLPSALKHQTEKKEEPDGFLEFPDFPGEFPEELPGEPAQEKKKSRRENHKKSGQGSGEKVEEKKQKRRYIRNTAAGCLLAVLVLLAVLAACLLGYLPWLQAEWVLAAAAAVMAAGCLICFLAGRGNRQKEDVSWREKVQDEIFGRGDEVPEPPADSAALQMEIPEPEEAPPEPGTDFGETVVLSARTDAGPASLVSREPGELATIYLKDELTVIGKLSPAADAVIPLPTVSRVHARIRKRGDEYYLADLNSRNGTAVNGRLLKGDEEYCLQDEDEVDFAQARYVFLK